MHHQEQKNRVLVTVFGGWRVQWTTNFWVVKNLIVVASTRSRVGGMSHPAHRPLQATHLMVRMIANQSDIPIAPNTAEGTPSIVIERGPPNQQNQNRKRRCQLNRHQTETQNPKNRVLTQHCLLDITYLKPSLFAYRL
ncbi:hypothetical protein FGIG_11736 [Fasciola gigantica]|uniref:Uncharacterized protein n=1 Tax=Fasciola gigantica TaxID=46835 RepID=A0A504Z9F3_FASGI|nr:hypothetical protein FGIG_11736 [Fasciola gigantica]